MPKLRGSFTVSYKVRPYVGKPFKSSQRYSWRLTKDFVLFSVGSCSGRGEFQLGWLIIVE